MAHKLEEHIEAIIDSITDGKTFRQIAEEFDCSLTHFHRFITNEEHSARVSTALAVSASSYANKGEEVLKDAKINKHPIEMTRARELAQHYRWMAGKRNPKKYGEAQLLKLGDHEGGEIKMNAIFSTDILKKPDVQTDDSTK